MYDIFISIVTFQSFIILSDYKYCPIYFSFNICFKKVF